jgi:hypothetical protein
MNLEKNIEKSIASNGWLVFIRATMFVIWTISVWAIKTLLSIDKNVAVMAQSIMTIEHRLNGVESKIQEDERSLMRGDRR